MTEKTSDVRFRSRIWSVLRAIVFICVIIFIWNGMSKTACAFVGIALVMGWVNLYQLRFQEIEKQKAENDKAAAQAQEKLNTELDDLQKNFNAVANGKTNNIVG